MNTNCIKCMPIILSTVYSGTESHSRKILVCIFWKKEKKNQNLIRDELQILLLDFAPNRPILWTTTVGGKPEWNERIFRNSDISVKWKQVFPFYQ